MQAEHCPAMQSPEGHCVLSIQMHCPRIHNPVTHCRLSVHCSSGSSGTSGKTVRSPVVPLMPVVPVVPVVPVIPVVPVTPVVPVVPVIPVVPVVPAPTQRMHGNCAVAWQVCPVMEQNADPPCAHSLPPQVMKRLDAADERRDDTEEPMPHWIEHCVCVSEHPAAVPQKPETQQ